MSTLQQKLSDFQKFVAFQEALAGAGVAVKTWYEARPFEGAQDRASAALDMRVGVFSWGTACNSEVLE